MCAISVYALSYTQHSPRHPIHMLASAPGVHIVPRDSTHKRKHQVGLYRDSSHRAERSILSGRRSPLRPAHRPHLISRTPARAIRADLLHAPPAPALLLVHPCPGSHASAPRPSTVSAPSATSGGGQPSP